jgi:uncharacterized membrane protein
MSRPSRLPAVVAYLIPVIGWVYVYAFQRKNTLAMYHLRQSIGLCLFLVTTLIGWAAVAWGLAWLPYMGALSAALFTLVIAAFLFGIAAWILGLFNALSKRMVPLPGFGRWANRLPGMVEKNVRRFVPRH